MRSTASQLEVHTGAKKKAKLVPYVIDAPVAPFLPPTLGVCLLHGASGDHTSGTLPALAAACIAAGLPCLRFTCRGGQLQHRIDVCQAVLEQAGSLPGLERVQRWVLAGHSMGARVACAVASDPQQQEGLAVACMLFSYPLHPPGQPQQLRDALLTQLTLPVLLVRGSKDGFSQQEQWDAALRSMRSSSWRQHSVEGGGHSLQVSGGGKQGSGSERSEEALQGVCAAVQEFLNEVAAAQQQPQGPRQRRQSGEGQQAAAAPSRKAAAAVAGSTAAGGSEAAADKQPGKPQAPKAGSGGANAGGKRKAPLPAATRQQSGQPASRRKQPERSGKQPSAAQ